MSCPEDDDELSSRSVSDDAESDASSSEDGGGSEDSSSLSSSSYDERDEEDVDFAKYWKPQESDVVRGLETRRKPLKSLDILCGTYNWFYQIPCYDVPIDLEQYKRDEIGSLVLSCPKGEPATLSNLSGHFRFFLASGHFTGLTLVEGHTNWWDVNSMTWEPDRNPENLGTESHGLTVLQEQDDDGNPFVQFRVLYHHGPFGEEYNDIIGKKQPEPEKPIGLTSAECGRLGMGMTYTEVAKVAYKRMRKAEKAEKWAERQCELAAKEQSGTSNTLKRKAGQTDGEGKKKTKVAKVSRKS